MKYRLYGLFSILSWGLAPIVLKSFLSALPIEVILFYILISAWIPVIFSFNNVSIFKTKTFWIHSVILWLLTIIHYFGNFYGIIYGNIILTTLIIKNSPIFQKLLYSFIYKQQWSKVEYIFWMIFVLWIILLNYVPNEWIQISNWLTVLLPIISSLARAVLMIFLSKIQKEKEVLWVWNIFSSLLVLLYIWYTKIHIPILTNLSYLQYVILLWLWIIPTYLWSLTWARAIQWLWTKVIFLDYVTPIISIAWSLCLFQLKLNTINYCWIALIFSWLIIRGIISKKWIL